MKVTDLNEQLIEVTDLSAALEQATFFKDCHQEPPEPITDSRQQAYWTDIYAKLIALHSNAVENRNNRL